MSGDSVVISGLGFVTNIGRSIDAVAARLESGRHGFSRVELRPGFELPIKIAGVVKGYDFRSPDSRDWRLPEDSAVDPRREPSLPPHGIYAVDALEQAISQACLDRVRLTDGSTGLYAASSGSPHLLLHHLTEFERTGWKRGHPLGITRSIAGTLNFNLAARYGIRGSNCGFVSACTSSSHALGYAYDEIFRGRQERMLVVGAEECFVENVLPFDAMRALSSNDDPDTACRPFDQDRDGFVVSGGAVAMVLEAASVANVPPLARMSGWGQASDGFHVASPHPEGVGLADAMKRALRDAGVEPAEVDYVNAHATSTPAGDRAEALALRAVFVPHKTRPAIVSTKGLTGHGLSLSGVMEAALTVLSIDRGFLPGNRNLLRPDSTTDGMHLPTRSTRLAIRTALNNSSGFGGSNVCHLFSSARG